MSLTGKEALPGGHANLKSFNPLAVSKTDKKAPTTKRVVKSKTKKSIVTASNEVEFGESIHVKLLKVNTDGNSHIQLFAVMTHVVPLFYICIYSIRPRLGFLYREVTSRSPRAKTVWTQTHTVLWEKFRDDLKPNLTLNRLLLIDKGMVVR